MPQVFVGLAWDFAVAPQASLSFKATFTDACSAWSPTTSCSSRAFPYLKCGCLTMHCMMMHNLGWSNTVYLLKLVPSPICNHLSDGKWHTLG
eukprot:2416199-Amphidinium_carterae.3